MKKVRFAVTAVLLTTFVYTLTRGIRYLRRVLWQPMLPDMRVSIAAETDSVSDHGYAIALANLRGGIEKRPLADGTEKLVLCAGVRNFREPWARDFGFASYGLMAAGEVQAVKEGLELFLITQRPSGQFPVKIHSTTIPDRYIHSLFNRQQPIHDPIEPKYVTAHNTISLDGNALIVIAALNYAAVSGDTDFTDTHRQALVQAVAWLEDQADVPHGLLTQGAYTDWADSVGRTGKILYTNVLYWKALHDLGFDEKAALVKTAVNAHFWRDDLGYFITSQDHDMLSSDGNLLAIAWGMATPAQADQILTCMDAFGMADPVPTQVTNEAYPDKFIAIENRLGGIGHYHTHAAWLWLGGWHIVALARAGRDAEAQELFKRASEAIARDRVVHEVYDRDGAYLSTRWYTSEAPLTWSAGVLVYAWHEMKAKR